MTDRSGTFAPHRGSEATAAISEAHVLSDSCSVWSQATVREWANQADVDAGERPGTTNEDNDRRAAR